MLWLNHLEGGPKRVNHAAVAVGHKIYSFGGYCTGENSREYTSMDVHVLNTTTFRWTRHPVGDLPYFENDDILPFKRYGHTVVVYREKVYLWGGRNDRSSDGTLFCFDTAWHCWTAPKTTGNLPMPRDGHTACIWKHYMVIFGGYEEDTDTFADAVYALDLNKMHWTYIPTRGTIQPSLRDFHTAVPVRNRMYLFGGRGTVSDVGRLDDNQFEDYPSDVWYLDFNTFTWVRPEVAGDTPVGRRSHSAFVYDEKMYIFGGYNASKEVHFNDLYEFNPLTNRWRLVHPNGNCRPCKRRRQACVLVANRMFLFGGTSPQLPYVPCETPEDRLVDHGDMYVLDLSPSLKTLCILCVKNECLDDTALPESLRMEIYNTFAPNKIAAATSRPSNSAG